jgi:hypothetical protein
VIVLGHIVVDAAFQPSVWRDSYFANHLRWLLVIAHADESAMPQVPASVHSTKTSWQTSFGLSQRHWCIFSGVNDSPHREALFSGRFLNGHYATINISRPAKSPLELEAQNCSSLKAK